MEDAEPLFNYSRFVDWKSISPAHITSATLHTRFLAIASSNGYVHMFELLASGKEWRRYQAHTHCINDICTDEAGEFVGTASEDGSVVVAAVHTDERSQHTHHKAVKSVRLAPDFARQRDRPLITGGVNGRVHMLKRGWLFGSMSEKLIHEGEGPIRAIAWAGPLLAWANDVGVKVYDLERDTRVSYVEAPTNDLDLSRCPPKLYWESENSLLIAWGQHVRVLSITRVVDTSIPLARSTSDEHAGTRRAGEITARILVPDALICGISPFGDDIAVLCYVPLFHSDDSAKPLKGVTVELRLFSRLGEYSCLYRERILVHTCNTDVDRLRATPTAYHLVSDHDGAVGVEGLPILFVVSPDDVICAQPRGVADHIDWELKHERYDVAVAVALQNKDLLAKAKINDVCERYIRSLLVLDDPTCNVAIICGHIYEDDAAACEAWIERIISGGYVRVAKQFTDAITAKCLAPKDAKAALPVISERNVTLLLRFLLQQGEVEYVTEITRRLNVAVTQSADIVLPYSAAPLCEDAEAMKKRNKGAVSDSALVDCLVELYLAARRFDDAISLGLASVRTDKADQMFALIQRHALFSLVKHFIAPLATLDVDKLAALVVENIDLFDISELASALQPYPAKLLTVLHHILLEKTDVYNKINYKDLHMRHLRLCMEYDRSKLQALLEKSRHYDVAVAKDVCQSTHPPMHYELLTVLSRMGSSREAVNLALMTLRDIQAAVDVARRFDDRELWAYLINTTIETHDGELIAELLRQVVKHNAGPIAEVVSRLPEGVTIADLTTLLVKVIKDSHVEASMYASCGYLCSRDVMVLIQKLTAAVKAPSVITPTASCALCNAALNATAPEDTSHSLDDDKPAEASNRCVVFHCSHLYHERCLNKYDEKLIEMQRARAGSDFGRRRGNSTASASHRSTDGFARESGHLLASNSRRRRSSSNIRGAYDIDTASETAGTSDRPKRCPLCSSSSEPQAM